MTDYQVSDEQLEEIVEYALGFCPDTGPIEWDDLLYRIEKAFDLDLPGQWLDPEIKRIKNAILKARREANA